MKISASIIHKIQLTFALITLSFIITIGVVFIGMNQIHGQMQHIASSSVPLVSLSNQLSVSLLTAEKQFKDVLTSQDNARMKDSLTAFKASQAETLAQLTRLKGGLKDNELRVSISALTVIERQYFAEALQIMSTHKTLLTEGRQIEQAKQEEQELYRKLSTGMKEYVAEHNSISVKFVAKSFFQKLRESHLATTKSLTTIDMAEIKAAMSRNQNRVLKLKKGYASLSRSIPSFDQVFKKNFRAYLVHISQPQGVQGQHQTYTGKQAEQYQNILTQAGNIDHAIAALVNLTDEINRTMNGSLLQADESYQGSLQQAILLSIITFLFVAVTGWKITQGIRRPLRNTLQTLEQLTKGDMTQRVKTGYDNEFNQLGSFINILAEHLHSILQQLNRASDELTEVSTENKSVIASTQSSLKVQQCQSASVTDRIHSMEASVHNVLACSQESLAKVAEIGTVSSTGRDEMNENMAIVRQLSEKMQESVAVVDGLNDLSADIGTILDVIRNIADQTNLLALNAAIEAARAGEQGRGFAVVADEVRVLAKKTADSTQEVEQMISNLQSSSASATGMIRQCFEEMNLTVSKTNNVEESMQAIQLLIQDIKQKTLDGDAASQQQFSITQEVVTHIDDIHRIANDNHDAMSRVSTNGAVLDELARKQNELVSQFNL